MWFLFFFLILSTATANIFSHWIDMETVKNWRKTISQPKDKNGLDKHQMHIHKTPDSKRNEDRKQWDFIFIFISFFLLFKFCIVKQNVHEAEGSNGIFEIVWYVRMLVQCIRCTKFFIHFDSITYSGCLNYLWISFKYKSHINSPIHKIIKKKKSKKLL